MAAWIKMSLGMEVGLSPGDFVLDGDPAPLSKKGGEPPQKKFPAHVYGWCYFPSVGTEIKCNNSLFSVRTDGNLYAYIGYFPSIGTEIYS